MVSLPKPRFGLIASFLSALVAVSACDQGIGSHGDDVLAPGVNRMATEESGVEVGHRLIAAAEYELAIKSFSRAALDRGETDAEILLGMGTANLGLGRLNQAERLLRLAIEKQSDWPELHNNLGVVLMEKGDIRQAAGVFRKAYGLDNGHSEEIRDNLRLALAKTANPDWASENENSYKLVRRGSGDYPIRTTP